MFVGDAAAAAAATVALVFFFYFGEFHFGCVGAFWSTSLWQDNYHLLQCVSVSLRALHRDVYSCSLCIGSDCGIGRL